ncbi:MAG: hypothetical protein WAW23_04590, partial [Candidatus Methanoperedens sp.]
QPNMPEKSSINLENILKVERDGRKKLVPLESDFYEKVARQIRELEDEKRKIENTYSTKSAIIDGELKNLRNVVESIIYHRITKIDKEARHNAEIYSLHASSKEVENHELDPMTPEEREFYNKLLELMTEYRGELFDKIFKTKEERLVPPQPVATQENKQKEIPIEDKKDISKEYIVVRLLKDIPTFVGVDGRNYTLAKEDIAVLSAVNAKALINRKAAVQITVKR